MGGPIEIWDLVTRKCIFQHDQCRSAKLSPDGNKIMTGLVDSVKVWDLNYSLSLDQLLKRIIQGE